MFLSASCSGSERSF